MKILWILLILLGILLLGLAAFFGIRAVVQYIHRHFMAQLAVLLSRFDDGSLVSIKIQRYDLMILHDVPPCRSNLKAFIYYDGYSLRILSQLTYFLKIFSSTPKFSSRPRIR